MTDISREPIPTQPRKSKEPARKASSRASIGKGCTSSNRSRDPAYWQDGTLWYDETKEGDRFGYSGYRAIDDRTHILKTKLQMTGSFANSNYLAVRRSVAMDWNPMVDPPRHTITTLTRLGEVRKAEEVEAFVKAATAK